MLEKNETGNCLYSTAPESLAMVLAKFLPDRSTPIESKSHSPMKNTAKTTSPAFFKLCLQINDLQSSLMFRVLHKNSTSRLLFRFRHSGLVHPGVDSEHGRAVGF